MSRISARGGSQPSWSASSTTSPSTPPTRPARRSSSTPLTCATISATSPRTPTSPNSFFEHGDSGIRLLALRGPEPHIERAFAAEPSRRFRIAHDEGSEVGLLQPVRHRLAQHAPFLGLVEASSRVRLGAPPGDDQHMAMAFPLRRFEEPPKRGMRLALAHAMQVE